jgi:hypothetical protein
LGQATGQKIGQVYFSYTVKRSCRGANISKYWDIFAKHLALILGADHRCDSMCVTAHGAAGTQTSLNTYFRREDEGNVVSASADLNAKFVKYVLSGVWAGRRCSGSLGHCIFTETWVTWAQDCGP